MPPVRDALSTLRANLTLRSTVFRHALRVAVTLLIASGINRGFQLSRGYWIPMTAVLVLRPEFQDTFVRGGARIVGTILGAGIATLIVNVYTPGPIALMLLVLVFGWGCYALFRMNYALFTISLTGYVVFILMLSGVAEMTAAMARATYTLAGGLLALVIYAVWPTWAASTARPELGVGPRRAGGLRGRAAGRVRQPRRLDFARLAHMRSDARLARSNAEAVVERMIAEPARRASIAPRAAVGLLAAVRRNALGALALQAGLERGAAEPVDGLEPLAREIACQPCSHHRGADVGRSAGAASSASSDPAGTAARGKGDCRHRNRPAGRQHQHHGGTAGVGRGPAPRSLNARSATPGNAPPID